MKRSELRRKTPLEGGSELKRKPMRRRAKRPANDATHHSAIRKAAEGELCTVQIAGICRHDTEHTVLAHLPHESGIMGGKVDDLSSCFACDACHRVVDGVQPWPGDEGRHELEFAKGVHHDAETGEHHLAHAACCLLFRLELLLREES